MPASAENVDWNKVVGRNKYLKNFLFPKTQHEITLYCYSGYLFFILSLTLSCLALGIFCVSPRIEPREFLGRRYSDIQLEYPRRASDAWARSGMMFMKNLILKHDTPKEGETRQTSEVNMAGSAMTRFTVLCLRALSARFFAKLPVVNFSEYFRNRLERSLTWNFM